MGLDSIKVNGFNYLATYCVEKYLKFIKFDQDKAYCILNIFTGDCISFYKSLEDRLAIVLKKGFFEIFQLSR